MRSSVVGVWNLRSFFMENVDTKERSEPFGPEPRGSLILHPDGRMAALITPRDRLVPPSGADAAAIAPQLIAYSGRYRLEPPNRLVTSVDVASIEAWIGTDQARTYVLDGDRLDIITPPGRLPRQDADAVTVVGTLSWSREASPTEEAHRVSNRESIRSR